MPWTADEEKRVRALEDDVKSIRGDVRRHLTDSESAWRQRRDLEMHERETFLASATRTIEAAVAGKLAGLHEGLHTVEQVRVMTLAQNTTLAEQDDKLDAIAGELALSREERIARKTLEADAATRAEAARSKRRRVWSAVKVLGVFVVPVIAAFAGAAVSQCTAQHVAPPTAPASPHH